MRRHEKIYLWHERIFVVVVMVANAVVMATMRVKMMMMNDAFA